MTPADQVRSFRDLLVWEEAIELSVQIHRATTHLPQEHKFELGRELRRSSISVPSNIAEGFNGHSRPRYRRHVAIALGSDAELESQVEVAKRLQLFPWAVHEDLLHRCDLVGRLLQGLWRSLKSQEGGTLPDRERN
jgi:four helix bundle protein